jgi:hypothetical protein
MQFRLFLFFLLGAVCIVPIVKAQTPWQWAHSAGGLGNDLPSAIALDAQSNVYVCGWFQDSAFFGTTFIKSAKGIHLFLAKYSTEGDLIWVQTTGSNGTSYATSVIISPNNTICLAGFFSGTVLFGDSSITSTGANDVFLANFSLDGAIQWVRSSGGASNDNAYSVSSDRDGGLYLTGSFSSVMHVGSFDLTSAGGTDIFVAKYSISGNVLWAKRFGGKTDDVAKGIAVAPSGNLLLTGSFSDTADLGGTLLAAKGSSDIFISKYTSDGKLQWARNAGGTAYGEGEAIAFDAGENVYATGKFFDTIDIGGTPPDCDGFGNIFITKFNSAGIREWIKCAGGGGEEGGNGIEIGNDGNLYICGAYDVDIDLGTGVLPNYGLSDLFVAKFDPAGNALWSDRAGSTGFDFATGIAVDKADNIYFTAQYSDTCSFGPFILSSRRLTDIATAKIGKLSAVRDRHTYAPISYSVYPNPARTSVTIDFDLEMYRDLELELIDPLGVVVEKKVLSQTEMHEKNVTIGLNHCVSGIYFLSLSSGGMRRMEKIMVSY